MRSHSLSSFNLGPAGASRRAFPVAARSLVHPAFALGDRCDGSHPQPARLFLSLNQPYDQTNPTPSPMSDERSSKRQRHEESESDAQARDNAPEVEGFYTHGDVWLEDGNVVLVAEGTAFRVFRSVLAKNSEIFRDMFNLPQPESTEMYAGCPVVGLHDSKADLRWILKALYDSGNAYVLLSYPQAIRQ